MYSWFSGATRMLKSCDLPTIDEYLAMQDWVFSPQIKQGTHGDYFWVHYLGLDTYDPFDRIDPPSVPFCLAVRPSFDSSQSVAMIGAKPGWNANGNFAISNWNFNMKHVDLGGFGARFVIDTLKSETRINEALVDFEDFFFLAPESLEKFLRVVSDLQPYCCATGDLFIARGKELYEQFFNDELLDEIRRDEWRSELEERRSFWKNQGPECGPEVCSEPQCDRLRIKLSVNCFVHHAYKFFRAGIISG